MSFCCLASALAAALALSLLGLLELAHFRVGPSFVCRWDLTHQEPIALVLVGYLPVVGIDFVRAQLAKEFLFCDLYRFAVVQLPGMYNQ